MARHRGTLKLPPHRGGGSACRRCSARCSVERRSEMARRREAAEQNEQRHVKDSKFFEIFIFTVYYGDTYVDF